MVLTAAECLRSFKAAVRDGRRGQYGAAIEIVERVRKAAGDESAERAKKELWAYIKSGKAA
ncbi:hypothetical protein [Burkholderia ubonensis]|uniref:Uncharacterized protein n=1 Tax=Burkholderia ubonensis TaxID=101571 RepID=A0ABD4EBG7_9BURK|nr:hypothetical protein [Burkholderia ubonensis]KVN92575.1 hypothetical protein WJ68_33685 [Burkholderia ubonensis]